MTVVQLASQEDVEKVLGRDLTSAEEARVDAILDKASELFRREARQKFTPGRSQVRVKINGGSGYLRERPVTAIHSVTDEQGRPVTFTRFKQWLSVPKRSHEFVIVDYFHGGGVPDLVRLTIADIARQVLSINPNAAAGVTQHSQNAGSYSEQSTYATWAQGGATRLAPDDIAVARSFRVKTANVWVQSS